MFKKARKQLLPLIFGMLVILAPILYLSTKKTQVVHADTRLSFDEGYGNTTGGSDGSNFGTIVNATWQTSDLCRQERCLYFDGSGDYVNFADYADFDIGSSNNSVTIEGWFRHPEISTNPDYLIAKHESGTAGGYKIFMDSDGDIAFAIDDDGTWGPEDVVGDDQSKNYDDNKWHHFAAVKDAQNGIFLYVDGILIDSDESLTATGDLANAASFYVGIDADGSSNSWAGFIDEISIVREARTQTEIITDYLGSRPQTSGRDPIGWWKFDESSWTNDCATQDVYDSSGSAYNGTSCPNAGGQTTPVTGVHGNAIHLDGSDDVVLLGGTDNDNLVPTSPRDGFTITAWISRDTYTTHDIIYAKTDDLTSAEDQLAFYVNNTDELVLLLDDGATSYFHNGTTTITSADWVHVAVTFQENGGSDESHMYINGVDDGSTGGGSFVTGIDNIDDVVIGGEDDGGGVGSFAFDGSIDDVKYYDYVRSPEQILEDMVEYQSPRGTAASFGGGNDSWLSNGLVGYWKMDESSWSGVANEVTDYSGNANHGVGNNGATTGSGNFGRAGIFDNIDNDVSITDTDSLSFGDSSSDSPFSVSAWINMTDATYFPILTKCDTNNEYEYRFGTTSGNTLGMRIYDSSSSVYIQSEYSVDLSSEESSWIHVSTTYDGSGNASGIKLYIDGAEVSSTAGSSDSYTAMHNTTYPPRIGQFCQLEGDFYSAQGSIDEVRVYNRLLSGAEIQQLYNWAPGPVGYWKLDENSGTSTIYDTSGNGHSGTMNGLSESSWVSGKYGSGLQFDTNSQYANIGTTFNEFDSLEGASYMAWVKPDFNSSDSYGTNPYIFSDENIANLYYADAASVMRCGINTSGGGQAASAVSGWSAGEWHHVACVYDGSSIKLYWDGVLEDDNLITGTINTATSNTVIGSVFNFATTQSWSGVLDEVKTYNYARTAAQIVEDMNADHPTPGSPVGSEVGHWKMDEEGTNYLFDTGPNELNLIKAYTTQRTPNGKFERAVDFESDYTEFAYMADSSITSLTGNVTLSAWIKPESTTAATSYAIAGKWGSSAESYLLMQYGDEIRMYIDSSSNYETTNAANLSTGTWYYVAGVYDAAAQTVKLYVNGVEQASTTTGTIPSSIGDATDSFGIGAVPGAIVTEQIGSSGDDGMELGIDGNWYATGDGNEIAFGYDSTYLDVHAGYRFQTVAIPAGSTVNSAFIYTYATRFVGTITSVHGKFYGDDVGDAAVWSSTSGPTDITDTTANIDWDPTTWPYGKWVTSPNIGSIVNEIVNNGSWVSGNDMRIALRNDGTTGSNNLVHYDYNGDTEHPTKLVVIYGASSGYDGVIDEVKLYSSALTADQIKADMNQGKATTWGATSTDSSGNATWSTNEAFCPPGQGTSCTPPVGYYKFDENTGTTVIDAARENPSTLVGGSASNWVNGKKGSAIKFANSQQINTYSNYGLSNNSFSIGAWVKRTGTGVVDPIVADSGSSANNAFWLEFEATDYIRCDFFSNNLQSANTYTDTDNWHHIVCTYDASTNDRRLYVDGILAGQDTSAADYQGTTNFRIGYRHSGMAYAEAIIDEVRIYDYARTPAQVAWEYNRGGPVGWWKFDESSWTNDCATETVFDSSGHDYHGVSCPNAGGQTTPVAGKFSNAMDFDGSNDHVRVGGSDNDNLVPTRPQDGFTITAWINRDTFTTQDIIYAKTNDLTTGSDQLVFYINSTDELILLLDDGPVAYTHFGTTKILSSGWNHVAVTFQENGASDTSTMYFNGQDEGGIKQGSFATGIDNAYAVSIGHEADGAGLGSFGFDGKIDDVRYYNYVLTEQQIRDVMSYGAVNFGY